ncbi:hypothetical protein L6164_037808 [Bauhinia variegata]|uniref:Uncharacterized protein n=1 Tax=Bauhinia variegata TaxID=167791 RepID=A0ACB9KKZ5_BAUVA|nr:hypothetical protein L6164_037808 [Bauhinia variegata]
MGKDDLIEIREASTSHLVELTPTTCDGRLPNSVVQNWSRTRPSASTRVNRTSYSAKETRIIPPSRFFANDKLCWGHPPDGDFSVKSAYTQLEGAQTNPYRKQWDKVWGQRIRSFLWLTLHDRFITNSSRVRRHMAIDASCPIYEVRSLCDDCYVLSQGNPPCSRALGNHGFCSSHQRGTVNRLAPTGWVKVNTDGAYRRSVNQATAGGLQLAWNMGARQVVIEVDSLLAVDLVSRCSAHVNNNFSLVDGIKHLMARDWIVKVT